MSVWLVGICVEKTVKPGPRVDTLFSAQGNKSFPQFPANVSITLNLWMRAFDFKERKSLVSTYVVCERLSVMHEPAGVVENLVQILQNTPIL